MDRIQGLRVAILEMAVISIKRGSPEDLGEIANFFSSLRIRQKNGMRRVSEYPPCEYPSKPLMIARVVTDTGCSILKEERP